MVRKITFDCDLLFEHHFHSLLRSYFLFLIIIIIIIITAISRTVPQPQRHQVLEDTLRFLSHEDVALHDYEVDNGMDRALCLQLGYLDMIISTSSPVSNGNSSNNQQVEKEQILICWCLTRIYQCSRERRLRSFREMGVSDLLPILVKILKRYAAASTTQPQLALDDNITYPVVLLLRIFAKLDTHTKSSLLRWKDGRLLDVLVSLLFFSQQPVTATEAFGFLKDISFRLLDNDKEFMYSKLSNFLKQSINHNVKDETTTGDVALKEKRLESLSAIYWNLATSSKISMDMGHSPDVLKSLGQLLKYPQSDRDDAVKIKKNAVSAFGNVVVALTARGSILTVTDTNCPAKSDDRNANLAILQQDWIRPTLFHLLRDESDQDVQRRTMRTIRCLTSCSWGKILLLRGDKAVTSCSAAAVNELNSYFILVLAKDSIFDVSTRIQVCETIGSLSQDPAVMKVIGQNFEQTLVQTIEQAYSTPHLGGQQQASLVASACKALHLVWERGTWGQERPVPPSDSFFSSLLSCSKIDPEITHPPVAKLLLKLGFKICRSNAAELLAGAPAGHPDDSEIESLGCDSSNNILSKPLFDTLSELLQPVGPCFDESRQDTLELLQLFLQNDANKRILAEHEGLLTALVGFALMTSQDDKKKRAKRLILLLVPEL